MHLPSPPYPAASLGNRHCPVPPSFALRLDARLIAPLQTYSPLICAPLGVVRMLTPRRFRASSELGAGFRSKGLRLSGGRGPRRTGKVFTPLMQASCLATTRHWLVGGIAQMQPVCECSRCKPRRSRKSAFQTFRISRTKSQEVILYCEECRLRLWPEGM